MKKRIKNGKQVAAERSAVIYCRSAYFNRQSIENQVALTNEYAKANGYTVVKAIIDNGVSGLKNKRSLSKILKLAKKRKIDTLICVDISRISRNLHQYTTFLSKLKQFEVTIQLLS